MTRPFPKVDCERLHPAPPVKDAAAAVEFYTTRLGFTPGFTWPEDAPPTMAAVTLGEVQVFLEQGTPNPDGISVYFVVGNADELYKRMSLSSCLEEILLHSNDQLEQLRTWNSELRTKTRRLQNSGLDVPGSGVRSSKFEVRSSTGRQAGGAPQPPDTAYDGIGAGNFASPKASRMSRFVSKYTCQ